MVVRYITQQLHCLPLLCLDYYGSHGIFSTNYLDRMIVDESLRIHHKLEADAHILWTAFHTNTLIFNQARKSYNAALS